jgi:hypothetical protein
MALWIHEFEVIGRGNFPQDMLRYDSCYPQRSEDASNMALADDREYGFCYQKEHGEAPTFGIRLVHRDDTKNWQPTEGRWRSFGWRVNPHSVTSRKV